MRKFITLGLLGLAGLTYASTTNRLHLTINPVGTPNWGQSVNTNFQILDSTVNINGGGGGGGNAVLSATQTWTGTNKFMQKVGIGTTSPAYGLDVETSSYFGQGLNVGGSVSRLISANSTIYYEVNGTTAATMSDAATQLFGILDVSTITFSGGGGLIDWTHGKIWVSSMTLNGVAYTFPTSDGSSNQVLTTNGSGALRWATSTGGGAGASTSTANSWSQIQHFNGSLDTATATVTGSGFSVGGSTFVIAGGKIGIGVTTPVSVLDVRQTGWTSGQFQSPGFSVRSTGGLSDPTDVQFAMFSIVTDTASVNSAGSSGHVGGGFFASSDTANGHSLNIGVEGRNYAYGDGIYESVHAKATGYHTADSTFTLMGLYARTQSFLMDGTTANPTSGPQYNVYLDHQNGGVNGNKWSLMSISTQPSQFVGALGVGSSASSPLNIFSIQSSASNPGLNITQTGSNTTNLECHANAPSSSTYCGSTTNQRFYLQSSGIEALTVSTTSQRVGIGKTNPTAALDVTGTVNATAFVGDGSGLTGITSGSGASTSTVNSWSQHQFFNGGLDVSTITQTGAELSVGVSTFVIHLGQVGIGTTLPQAPLHVVGNSTTTGTAFVGGLTVMGGGGGTMAYQSTTGTISVPGNLNAIGVFSSSVTLNNAALTVWSTTATLANGYNVIHATIPLSVAISSITNSMAIDIGALSVQSQATITQIDAVSLPTGTTCLFQLDARTLASVGSAGTSVFTVTYATATSPGKQYVSSNFTAAAIANGSHLVLTTHPTTPQTGGSTCLSITIYYKEQ